MGAGSDTRCPAVGRVATGQLQRGLRAAAVPIPWAVLPVAGRRIRDSRPHGRAAGARGSGEAGAVFHRRKLSKLEQACRGNTFAQRRDAAILAVLRATGVRMAELAGIRYDPVSPGRSDLDLDRREIHVCGKGGRDRIVYCRRITDSPKPTESWSICSLTGHQRTSAHADERILTRPNSRSDRDPGSRPYARTTPKPGRQGRKHLSTSSLPTLRTRTVRSKCHEQCPYQPFQRAVPCRSRRVRLPGG